MFAGRYSVIRFVLYQVQVPKNDAWCYLARIKNHGLTTARMTCNGFFFNNDLFRHAPLEECNTTCFIVHFSNFFMIGDAVTWTISVLLHADFRIT